MRVGGRGSGVGSQKKEAEPLFSGHQPSAISYQPLAFSH